MQVNERVEVWVHRFLTTHRPQMEEYLVRDGLYGDMIREKLRPGECRRSSSTWP
jgi:hypothetical protein